MNWYRLLTVGGFAATIILLVLNFVQVISIGYIWSLVPAALALLFMWAWPFLSSLAFVLILTSIFDRRGFLI